MTNKAYALLTVQAFLSVVLLLYIYARGSGLSAQLFWPLLWALLIICIAIIFSLNDNLKVFSIIMMAMTLSLVPMSAMPEIHQIGRDEVFESQYAELLVEKGTWDPQMGTGFSADYYGYNPALHFQIAFMSIASGLSTFFLTKYVVFLMLRLMLVLSVYMLIKEIVGKNKNIVMISTLIFVGSAGLAFIAVSRRTAASIMLVMAIYSMLKHERLGELKWMLSFLIFSAMIVISNHTVAYYFLFFLLGAVAYRYLVPFIPRFRTRKPFGDIWIKTALYTVIFAAWEFYNGVIINKDISYVKQISATIMSGQGLSMFLGADTSVSVSIYHTYELLLIYAIQFMFLFLASLGLMLLVDKLFKHKKIFNYDLQFVYLAIFGLGMYVVSSVLMRTKLDVAVILILWLYSIPLSILIAYFLQGLKRWRKRVHFVYVVFIIVMLFTGSLMMGMYTPRLTNRAPMEDIVIGADIRSKATELYASGQWLSEYDPGARVLGDSDVFEVYSGFFRLDVNTYQTNLKRMYQGDEDVVRSLILRENILFGTYAHTRYNESLDYMVINEAFSRHYSRVFGNPISLSTDVLDSEQRLDKVYSNNNIMLYRTSR